MRSLSLEITGRQTSQRAAELSAITFRGNLPRRLKRHPFAVEAFEELYPLTTCGSTAPESAVFVKHPVSLFHPTLMIKVLPIFF